MRLRIWPFVSISFCVLLLLVPLFTWIVSKKEAEIDAKSKQVHQRYHHANNAITAIGADIYKAALLLRDPPSMQNKAAAQQNLQVFRQASEVQIKTLASLLGQTQHDTLESLHAELNNYWASAARAFEDVGTGGTLTRAYYDERRSQRETVLEVAQKIDALNSANFELEEQQINVQQRALKRFSAGATLGLLLLGIFIAAVSTAYLARLEAISDKQKNRAEQAEYELRRLSNQLVRAQEDERKTISRELHDEVGQILTGLRMELGGLWRGEADSEFRDRLHSVKSLAEEALRNVRNLALLLRPSMLDDLGLGAALRWQAKEFTNRSGIPVSVDIQGDINNLPENFRICLYRAIQEALTNCLKHAHASSVSITLAQEKDLVTASIRDDGAGFSPANLRTRGLGLVGMEERVRALQGELTILSKPGQGTLIRIELPLLRVQQAEHAEVS
jgi:signal transduction histidine kinase